jgi:hypothetical protein
MTANPFPQKLRSETDLQPKFQNWIASREIAEAVQLKHFAELHPHDEASRLTAEVAVTFDAEARKELLSRISVLSGQAAENARFAARGACLTAHGPVVEATVELLDAAISIANGYLVDDIADEKKLFQKWNMSPEGTAIAKRIRETISEMTTLKHGAINWEQKGVTSLLPTYQNCPVLQFFGISTT